MKDAFGIHAAPVHVDFAIPILPSPPITTFSPIQHQTTKNMYEKIKSQIDSLRLNEDIGVMQREDDSIVLRVNDSILFKPGQSKITSRSYSTLRTIADIIKPLPMNLRIEGHTDDALVSKNKFGNWDLSADRSISVLRFLAQSDLLPLDRMAAVGYGKKRPMVPNRDEATRALNRRVDFVLRLSADRSKSGSNLQDKTIPL